MKRSNCTEGDEGCEAGTAGALADIRDGCPPSWHRRVWAQRPLFGCHVLTALFVVKNGR